MSVGVRIAIAMLLCMTQIAWAKDSSEEATRCVQELTGPSAKPIDYALSDLEGLFFELIKKVQASDHVTPSHAESAIKEILAMKAQVLNNALHLLPLVEKPEMVGSIFQMLDSLGVPPAMYGLELDKHNRMIRKGPVYKQTLPPKEIPGPSIGFVNFAKSETRDLPDWLHRSIGFGPQQISQDAPPARATGSIRRTISPQAPYTLIVIDGESGATYKADLRVLNLFGIEFENHKYVLQFNQDVYEWVVAVENLSNPTGKIGFLNQ